MALESARLYNKDDQSFLIMDHLDQLYLNGQFVEANNWIKTIDIKKLSTNGLRSLCVCISWAFNKIECAIDIYRSCYVRMEELKGKALAKRLLWFVLEKI